MQFLEILVVFFIRIELLFEECGQYKKNRIE